MQPRDEQPETIHLYVVREVAPKPSILPIVLSALSLTVLLVYCVLTPYQQPVTRAVIRVPAVLLPVRTFTATVDVIPTGVRVYPATTAHGILAITNGSVIAQTIPQGFRLGNVVTDWQVFVPAGSANGYGYATVASHALISGKAGNIPAYAINRVEGGSVYIRNVTSFHGGNDSYTKPLQLPQDRQTALTKAREYLASITPGLHYPCTELISVEQLTWHCQFVTYKLPDYMRITEIKIVGKNLLLTVWFVARPIRVWVK